MNIKKNYFRLLLTFAVALTALFAVGCGSTAGDKSADAKKTVTVTTSFLQDMTKTLAGD